MKRYPAYKGSGVEWLGEVPVHWDVSPLKHLVRFRSGGTPSKENLSYWNGNVPWASSKDLKTEQLSRTEDQITSAALQDGAAELVPAGAVLVVVRGMILARAFPVTEALVPMAINQDLKAVLAGQRLNSSFLAWLLRGCASESLRRLDEAGHGTKALRMDAWSSMPLPLPSLPEQTAVAHFLNRETAKIDALIAEQEKLIALLAEKRQATISHAVTRGLDRALPMKDSGEAWIGKVPAHWTILRLRDACSTVSTGPFGTALGIDDYQSGGVPVVNPSHIIDSSIVPDDRVTVSASTADRLANWRLRVGDVVVARRGELGRAAVVGNESDGWICGTGSLRITPRHGRATARFLHAVLQAQFAREWLGQWSVGSTMANLSEAILGRLPLALPPKLSEQHAVIDGLDVRLHKTEQATDEARQCIALLRERRAALITAAVTGQIDVRGVVGPASNPQPPVTASLSAQPAASATPS